MHSARGGGVGPGVGRWKDVHAALVTLVVQPESGPVQQGPGALLASNCQMVHAELRQHEAWQASAVGPNVSLMPMHCVPLMLTVKPEASHAGGLYVESPSVKRQLMSNDEDEPACTAGANAAASSANTRGLMAAAFGVTLFGLFFNLERSLTFLVGARGGERDGSQSQRTDLWGGTRGFDEEAQPTPCAQCSTLAAPLTPSPHLPPPPEDANVRSPAVTGASRHSDAPAELMACLCNKIKQTQKGEREK